MTNWRKTKAGCSSPASIGITSSNSWNLSLKIAFLNSKVFITTKLSDALWARRGQCRDCRACHGLHRNEIIGNISNQTTVVAPLCRRLQRMFKTITSCRLSYPLEFNKRPYSVYHWAPYRNRRKAKHIIFGLFFGLWILDFGTFLELGTVERGPILAPFLDQ